VNLCPELRRLQAEHARWLAELGEEEGREDRLLALWEAEILPHCRREEEVLVPELSRRIPEADASILLALTDHVGLRRLARELRAARGAERGELAARLARRLAEHVAFEERTLFAAAQAELGSARLAEIGGELTSNQRGRKP
jgi:hypothetical protein